MSDVQQLKRYSWSISWIVTATASLMVVFFVFDTTRRYDTRQVALFDAAAMETSCHELPLVADRVACWFGESGAPEDFRAILAGIRAAIDEARDQGGNIGPLVETEYWLTQRLRYEFAQHNASMTKWLTSWALFTTACVAILVLVWLSYIPKVYRHVPRGRRFSLVFIGVPFGAASVLILAAAFSEEEAGQFWLLGLLAACFTSVLVYHLRRPRRPGKHRVRHAVVLAFALASAVGVALYFLERPEPVWLYLVLFATVFLAAMSYYRLSDSPSRAPFLFGLLWIFGAGITVSWATSSDWFIYTSLERVEPILSPDLHRLVSFHSVVRDGAVGLIVGFILLLTWPLEPLQDGPGSIPTRPEGRADSRWVIQYIQGTDELDQKLSILRDRLVGLRGILYAGAAMIGLGIVEIGFFYDLFQTRDPEYAVMVDELGRASKASVGAIFSLLLAGGYFLVALPLNAWLDEIRQQVTTPTEDFPGFHPHEWHIVVEHYQLGWARDLFSIPRLTILSSPALVGLTDQGLRALLSI